MSTRMPHRCAALGVAAGGVLLGHWLTYAVVAPATSQRTALLASTGHAYLGAADQMGLALTLVALTAIFLRRLTGGSGGTISYSQLIPRLAAFQILAFLAMEVAERIAAGVPVTHLFHGPILAVGCVVQAAVAAIGAGVIAWILKAARAAAAVLGSTPALPRLSFGELVSTAEAVPIQVHVPTARGRGPPHLI